MELTIGADRIRYTRSPAGLCREVFHGDGRTDTVRWPMPATDLAFRLERFGERPAILWVVIRRSEGVDRTERVHRLATAAVPGRGGAS